MDHVLTGFIQFLALVIALSVHEYSHALAGFLLGDETAKRMGRLTLNPLAHADTVGTIILPLASIMTGLPVIGWAKPVPFNPYNLRNQRWGPVMVALAGPISNFVSAVLYLVGLRIVLDVFHLPFSNLLVIFLTSLAVINIVLGVFNFIPVPPLDGARLVQTIFDAPKYRHFILFLETQGSMLLFFIIMIDFISPVSLLGSAFSAVIRVFFSAAGLA